MGSEVLAKVFLDTKNGSKEIGEEALRRWDTEVLGKMWRLLSSTYHLVKVLGSRTISTNHLLVRVEAP